MKCPHCQYEHKIGKHRDKTDPEISGMHGDFFKLPVKMEREVPYDEDEQIKLYACPKCDRTFINGEQ